MLRLSRELRQDVQLAGGERLGTLTDLTIRNDDPLPLVHRLVVRTPTLTRVVVPWEDVATFEHSLVQLASDERDPGWVEARRGEALPLAANELCLARDVLDTQIVNVNGHHVVRVADVLLTRRDDGRLFVAAVDVGFGSVVDRLGLHRLAHRFREQAVAWSDLHLMSRRGHQVQLETEHAAMHRLDPGDLAHLLDRLSPHAAGELMHRAPLARATAVLHDAPDEVGGRLLTTVSEQRASELLESLPPERANAYRRALQRVALPRRRFRRSRGWRRHPIPPDEP